MWETLVAPIAALLGKFVADKDEQLKLAHEIATLAQKQAHENALAQIEVNKTEAQSDGWFKGGWRPGAGWICVAGLALHFIIFPLAVFVVAFFGVAIPELPKFDMDTLMTLLFGLLGLGGLRTLEKVKK